MGWCCSLHVTMLLEEAHATTASGHLVNMLHEDKLGKPCQAKTGRLACHKGGACQSVQYRYDKDAALHIAAHWVLCITSHT